MLILQSCGNINKKRSYTQYTCINMATLKHNPSHVFLLFYQRNS